MLKVLNDSWATITINNKICTVWNITDLPNDFLSRFIELHNRYTNGVVLTAHKEPNDVFVVLSQGFKSTNNYYEIGDNNRVFLGNSNYLSLAK